MDGMQMGSHDCPIDDDDDDEDDTAYHGVSCAGNSITIDGFPSSSPRTKGVLK